MDVLKSAKSLVAYTNYSNAYSGRTIDCICAEQCDISFHICPVLENYFLKIKSVPALTYLNNSGTDLVFNKVLITCFGLR